jgi:hypothetical protein
MATTISITEILVDSGNFKKKQVDTLRLAQSLHKFVFEQKFVLEKKTEEWLKNNFLKALARSIESFGGGPLSEGAKTAYKLILECLQENDKRIIRRPRRQKSNEQVAVAA